MASIAPRSFPPPSTRTDPNPLKLTFANSKLSSSGLKRASPSFHSHSLSSPSLHRTSLSDSSLCRCNSNNSTAGDSLDDDSSSTPTARWDSSIQDAVWSAFKKLGDMKNSFLNWNRDKSVSLSGRERRSEVKEGAGYGGDEEEWDWEQWRKHFNDVDEQERIVSVLNVRFCLVYLCIFKKVLNFLLCFHRLVRFAV